MAASGPSTSIGLSQSTATIAVVLLAMACSTGSTSFSTENEMDGVRVIVWESEGGFTNGPDVIVFVKNRTTTAISRPLQVRGVLLHPNLPLAPGQTLRLELPGSLADGTPTTLSYGPVTVTSPGLQPLRDKPPW